MARRLPLKNTFWIDFSESGATRRVRGIMYVVLECAVCVLLALGVAACLFGLCMVFILFQEGYRRLSYLVERSVNSSRPMAPRILLLSPAPATRGNKPAARDISKLAI